MLNLLNKVKGVQAQKKEGRKETEETKLSKTEEDGMKKVFQLLVNSAPQ